MIPHQPSGAQARLALKALEPRLAKVEAIAPPHTDPHSAAVTALLVADWLIERGVDVEEARELRAMARALILLVRELGGDYLSDAGSVSAEIVARGHEVRTSSMRELECVLTHNPELELWLDALRRGTGAVDLVYDLRTLAMLHAEHAAVMPAAIANLPNMLQAAAEAIETSLRSDELPEQTTARRSVARLWTVFVPAYERAAAKARSVTEQEGAELHFPRLAMIAAHQRARRRESFPPADEIEVIAAVDIVRSEPPPKPEAPDQRVEDRASVELEVGIECGESLYFGFTENLSLTGVFVATYVAREMGSRVDVALTMPDGETLKIPGIVKWMRPASTDVWPGIGIEFTKLDGHTIRRIRELVSEHGPVGHT